jgi:hypothetical protein
MSEEEFLGRPSLLMFLLLLFTASSPVVKIV